MKTNNESVFYRVRIPILMCFIVVFLGSYTVHAQVDYIYDAAGNRTKCYIVQMPSKAGMLKSEEIKHNAGTREIRLYPNPTKGHLRLDIANGNDEESYNIKLYDMSGTQILDHYRKGNGSFNIDIHNHSSGTYILILITAEGKINYKIIKT